MSPKRKAVAAPTAAAEEVDGHASKKRKGLKETPDSTTEEGLAFLAQIKQARDKRDRLIATSFLTLPDKKQLPNYYKTIRLPIALDTVEGKLNRREYPTLTTLESDLKRLVSNAKSYNERSSDIFSDAEKIRKMVVFHMTKVNPAYETGTYVPFPTPLPEFVKEESLVAEAVGEIEPEEYIEKERRPSAASLSNPRRASSTPAVQDAEGAGESFEGNTFQQAQEKIMTEMIQLKSDNGVLISGPFVNLPSRELRDYYRLIKHPVCFKSAQKAVRGIRGRDKPTGVSFFRSWQAFEDEISYIWRNAREYNEDGSDIFELAGEFESYFQGRIAEAKAAVTEPQPKVKLRLSARSPDPTPKITLRFGGQKSNGVSVDNEALRRQQDLVRAGANGLGPVVGNGASSHPSPCKSFGSSHSRSDPTPIPPISQGSHEVNRSGPAEHPNTYTNGVKSESQIGQSPALGSVQLSRDSIGSHEAMQSPNLAASIMPPPASVTPRLPSGSPRPPTGHSNNHGSHAHNLNNPLASYWRQPGKDASDALISNLSIATHPGLKIDRHFHLDIPPSPSVSHQSITINLPSTHYYLRIIPTIAANVAHRPSKLFVTAGPSRLNPIPQRPEDADPRRPLYEARVIPGVNRIDIEMIAGPMRGVPKISSSPEIELEKITVFANILRA